MKIGDIAVPLADRHPLAPESRGIRIVVSVRPFVLFYEDGGRIIRGLNRNDFRIDGDAPIEAAVTAFSSYISMLSQEVDTHFEDRWADKAFNEIDAGFFSGDAFESAEMLARCEFFIERWKRRMTELKQFMIEFERERED